MSNKPPNAPLRPRIPPDSPAFSLASRFAIKVAALARNIRRVTPTPLATFPSTQALLIPALPPRKHPWKCPRIRQTVMFSWSACI